MPEPTTITKRTIAISFSIPNLAARRGAKEEQRANIISGIEVRIPNELTSTPSPTATSVKIAGKAVKGARITTPSITMPATINGDCFFIIFLLNFLTFGFQHF